MANQNTLTVERAVQILSSYKHVNNTEVDYKGIQVSNISRLDKDGKPFTYEESGDAYAIINFKAITSYGVAEAGRLLQEGDTQSATNQNLSIRMRMEEVEKLGLMPKQRGTLTLVEGTTKEGEAAIFGDTFVPNAKVEAKTFDFASFLAQGVEETADAQALQN